MVNYRRNRVSGGTYFLTLTLYDRSSKILTERIADLRMAFRSVLRERTFRLEAMVVLPEHLHILLTLPTGDNDFSGRLRLLKSRFTHALVKAEMPLHRNEKGEYNLWQRRFWEHTIRNEQDFTRHFDYIHWNPAKHGYVSRVVDWPYSTFHRCVGQGVYSLDWASDSVDELEFGEPGL